MKNSNMQDVTLKYVRGVLCFGAILYVSGYQEGALEEGAGMEFLKSRVFENVFKNQGAPLQRDSLVLVLDFGFGFLKTFSKICGSLFRGTPGLVLEFGFSFGFSLVLIWRCSLLRGSAQGRSGCGWR